MKTESDPIELDRDIVYKKPEKSTEKKTEKIPLSYIAGAIGVILILVLLFISPDNSKFIDSPPPAEQAERDSICSYATVIEQYSENFDSLPGQADISLPWGFTYEKEDELLWSIETEAGLYYSSDMNLEAFGRGEL